MIVALLWRDDGPDFERPYSGQCVQHSTLSLCEETHSILSPLSFTPAMSCASGPRKRDLSGKEKTFITSLSEHRSAGVTVIHHTPRPEHESGEGSDTAILLQLVEGLTFIAH